MMDTGSDSNNASAAIRQIVDARIKAIHDKDAKALLAMYMPDVVSYDLMKPLQNDGTDTISKRLANWFKNYDGPIDQEVANLTIAASGDVAFSYCLTRTVGTSLNGEIMDMWYRTTTCYRKVSNRWLINHDHNSEPFDMENGQVLLGLKP